LDDTQYNVNKIFNHKQLDHVVLANHK